MKTTIAAMLAAMLMLIAFGCRREQAEDDNPYRHAVQTHGEPRATVAVRFVDRVFLLSEDTAGKLEELVLEAARVDMVKADGGYEMTVEWQGLAMTFAGDDFAGLVHEAHAWFDRQRRLKPGDRGLRV